MTRQVVNEGDLSYTIALDDQMTIGNRMNALVQARLVDELTDTAITTGITVVPAGAALQKPAARLNMFSRVASGGLVGLAGVPNTVLPGLKTQAYEVGLSIRAEGYLPRQVTRLVGPQINFPATFALAALGDVAMHRQPVILRGRTVRRTANGPVAVANATVRVTGIWRTLPNANVVVPAGAPNLVSVYPPLYTDRTIVNGVVRTVTLTPTVGDDKQILDPVFTGSATIRLSNRENLSIGDVIAIDEGDVERREHVVILDIAGASSPSQPATITLAHPLAVSHALGTVVRAVTVSAPGPARALSIDAIPGDTTVFCTSVAGLGTPAFVEVSGGPGEKEYHWLRPYVVTSDPNGDYQLPPINRVAQISVEAQHAPDPTVVHTVGPLYPTREQYLDFTFV